MSRALITVHARLGGLQQRQRFRLRQLQGENRFGHRRFTGKVSGTNLAERRRAISDLWPPKPGTAPSRLRGFPEAMGRS